MSYFNSGRAGHASDITLRPIDKEDVVEGLGSSRHCVPLEGVQQTLNIMEGQLWLINPQRACAARVTVVAVCVCVCVCVCVSVKSHLTSGASDHRENAVTYSAGNKGQKMCGVFSTTAPLPRSSSPSLGWLYIRSAIFPADNTHAHCAYASSPRFAMCSGSMP